MYYYISGELVHTEPNTAVIEAGGVGYKLTVSAIALGRLANLNNSKVKLYTYLSIREDAHELFGFYSVEESSAFKMLISVSGVGPKAAMSILSLLTPEQFALAVTTENSKTLSKAPGVGLKTAMRIILELKDKLSKQGDFNASDVLALENNNIVVMSSGALGQAQNALLVLGYSRSDAAFALKNVDPSMSTEAMIKEALKKIKS